MLVLRCNFYSGNWVFVITCKHLWNLWIFLIFCSDYSNSPLSLPFFSFPCQREVHFTVTFSSHVLKRNTSLNSLYIFLQGSLQSLCTTKETASALTDFSLRRHIVFSSKMLSPTSFFSPHSSVSQFFFFYFFFNLDAFCFTFFPILFFPKWDWIPVELGFKLIF